VADESMTIYFQRQRRFQVQVQVRQTTVMVML
jgi:hypothetical protein